MAGDSQIIVFVCFDLFFFGSFGSFVFFWFFCCFWFFWLFWFFWVFWFFCFSGSFGFVCFLGCCDSDYVVCAVRGDLSASSTLNAHSQGPPFCIYMWTERAMEHPSTPKRDPNAITTNCRPPLLPLHVRRQEVYNPELLIGLVNPNPKLRA